MLMGIDQWVTAAAGGSEGTVLFDVALSGANSGGGVTTLTASINIGSGSNGTSNRALVAALCFCGSLTGTSTSPTVTYNGVAMDSLGNVTGTGGDVYLFGLKAPTTGIHSIVANWIGAGQAIFYALSVVGADQSGGVITFPSVTTNTGVSTTASTGPITSPNNRICFAGFSSVSSGFTTAGNTDIGHNNGGNIYDSAACYDVNNTNPTLTYSSANAAWTAIGCSIKGV